jgi:hypothetical protein
MPTSFCTALGGLVAATLALAQVALAEPGSNEPNGLLFETAFLPIFSNMPEPDGDEAMQLLKTGQDLYLREGIATALQGRRHGGASFRSRSRCSTRWSRRSTTAGPRSLSTAMATPRWMRSSRRITIDGARASIQTIRVAETMKEGKTVWSAL